MEIINALLEDSNFTIYIDKLFFKYSHLSQISISNYKSLSRARKKEMEIIKEINYIYLKFSLSEKFFLQYSLGNI